MSIEVSLRNSGKDMYAYDVTVLNSKDLSKVKQIKSDRSVPSLASSNVSMMGASVVDTTTREPLNMSRLRDSIRILRNDSDSDISSKEEVAKIIMDAEQIENRQLIDKLEMYVGSRCVNDEDRARLVSHWEYKSTKLSMKCLASVGDISKKEEQDESIKSLEEWKRIQKERVQTMKQGKNGRNATPPLFLHGGRSFASRAAVDPSFRSSLQRAVATARNMNEQLREEARIEIVAIEECLAVRGSEAVELNKELVFMKAILRSTYCKKSQREQILYELSCRICNKHGKFVGKTSTEEKLGSTVQKHFDEVVKTLSVKASKDKKSKQGSSPVLQTKDTTKNSNKNGPKESWSTKFAEHFAKHCKQARVTNTNCRIFPTSSKINNERHIIEFCQEYVKVEMLRRSVGMELYWEEWKQTCEDKETE